MDVLCFSSKYGYVIRSFLVVVFLQCEIATILIDESRFKYVLVLGRAV